MHPGYGRTGELRGETSSLHLPPCQGHPEPVAVTEERLLHILLFPQLGAPRSWPPNSQELEPFGMKLLLVSQLGLLYVAGVCGCCPLPPARQEGCLHGTHHGVLQAGKVSYRPPPLCSWIYSTLYALPPFLFSSPFCNSSSQMSHTRLLQEMSHCPGASLIHVAGGQMDELVPQNPGGGDTESAHCL